MVVFQREFSQFDALARLPDGTTILLLSSLAGKAPIGVDVKSALVSTERGAAGHISAVDEGNTPAP